MSDRYSRQTILPEVGAAGQARLQDATVLVIGAGGLGSVVLQLLGAAGVGHLVIIDHDRVEASNLHRQPLYRMSDLGQFKAQAARTALLATNPELRIDTVCERLTPANIKHWVASAQVVVDAADSFAVSYVSSDECQRVNKPLISASVLALSGYVGGFCGGAPSYRAVFPEIPNRAGSCAQAGVLGTAVGVMGSLQAHMVLGVLLGLPSGGLGQLVTVDFRNLRCSHFSFVNAPEPSAGALPFIAPEQVTATDVVYDLRNPIESPLSPLPTALRIDAEALQYVGSQLPAQQRIVLCCRTGVRAWRAARSLQRQGHHNVALLAFGD